METTRRHPRTMEDAFGPYARGPINPIGSDKRKLPRRKMAQATVSYLIAVVACSAAAVVAVVCE